MIRLFGSRPAPPRFKISEAELARGLAALGAEKRRQELRHRKQGTTARLRREIAAGVVARLEPTEGWR